ncbi:MAG: hypothetical protein ACH36H_11490 [Candidatus Nanopelagicales bacterium]
MRQIIDANTLDIEPGCYVDGHWGWRGIIHQVQQFEGVVYELDDDDVNVIDRFVAYELDDDGEAMISLADKAEEMLRNALRPGLTTEWHDGEFYVCSPADDSEAD